MSEPITMRQLVDQGHRCFCLQPKSNQKPPLVTEVWKFYIRVKHNETYVSNEGYATDYPGAYGAVNLADGQFILVDKLAMVCPVSIMGVHIVC